MPQVFLALCFLLAQSTQPSTETLRRFNHAAELQRAGDLERAAEEYRQLLAAAPNYMEAQANLGVVLARLGRYDEAVAAYQSALRLAPELPQLLLNLGLAHYRAGQYEEAAKVFAKLLSLSPDVNQARQLLGLSLIELGRNDEAVKHLEMTLTVTPDDPAVLYGLGLAYLRLHRSTDVQAIITRMMTQPETLPAAHLLKGQSFLGDFEFEQAAAELEMAARLKADLPRINYSLGLSYLKLNRNKDAVSAFERELKISPHDASTFFYLAYLFEAEGNLEVAREKIQIALRFDPGIPEANALLGKILIKQGRPSEALAPLEAAVSADGRDPDKRYQLARVYQQLGRQADAAREFAEVQRLKAAQLKTDRERTPQH